MSSPAPTAQSPDFHRDAVIARAERGRAMLERLAVIGMDLAEEIHERNVKTSYHPEPKHDPCRGFAAVSRAERLTVMLVTRMDAEIIAMRNGEFALARPARGIKAPPIAAAPQAVWTPPVAPEPPSPLRAKVRGAVWGAINHEVRDIHRAQETLDRLHENLIEREDYDRFLDRPFRACVEAICADLGLNPDWTQWSDENGFVTDEVGPHYNWPRLWAYNPRRAEERRKRDAPPPPSPSWGGSTREASGVGESGSSP
jgi:hypothetical protein